MKSFLFLLLLPFAGFAQQAASRQATKNPSFQIQFDTMVMHTNNTVIEKNHSSTITMDHSNIVLEGPVQISGDKTATNGKDEKTSDDFWTMKAVNAVIISASAPVLKGNLLTYNNEDKKGILKGHIRMMDNGTEKYIGEYARLDFSDNTYKIEKLK